MCIGTATYGMINIIKWKCDNIKNKNIINDIYNIVDNDNSYDNIIFDNLIKKNSDTIGWIKVNGTNINYPFVQANNNNYYLNHSFNKKKNSAGWVFLDYRNNFETLDKNNILYAHARKDKSMFGSLYNLLDNSWYDNKDNHIIKIFTKKENTLWQIFSIYIINTENYYITINFKNNQEFINYINISLNRSIYNFDVNLTSEDKILTLSTCNGKYKKLVVQAKLIKKEVKPQE